MNSHRTRLIQERDRLVAACESQRRRLAGEYRAVRHRLQGVDRVRHLMRRLKAYRGLWWAILMLLTAVYRARARRLTGVRKLTRPRNTLAE
jgi:hypothetical protein